MDSAKLNEWLHTVATIGVILSLIFVGLEIKQAREVALADVHQQRAAMAIEIERDYYPVESYLEARVKLRRGEELSETDILVLRGAQVAWLQYWENNFYQYRLGLLDEDAWQSSRRTIRGRLSRPLYRGYWESYRHQWREEFAKEVDAILKEAESGEQ